MSFKNYKLMLHSHILSKDLLKLMYIIAEGSIDTFLSSTHICLPPSFAFTLENKHSGLDTHIIS